jgi:hypothetical protein
MFRPSEHGAHMAAILPRRAIARDFSRLAASRELISCFGFEIEIEIEIDGEMSISSDRITSARRDLR